MTKKHKTLSMCIFIAVYNGAVIYSLHTQSNLRRLAYINGVYEGIILEHNGKVPWGKPDIKAITDSMYKAYTDKVSPY